MELFEEKSDLVSYKPKQYLLDYGELMQIFYSSE